MLLFSARACKINTTAQSNCDTDQSLLTWPDDDEESPEPACNAVGKAVYRCMKSLTLPQAVSVPLPGRFNKYVVNFPTDCTTSALKRCPEPDTLPSVPIWGVSLYTPIRTRISGFKETKPLFSLWRHKTHVVSDVAGIERNDFQGLASKLLKIKMASGAFDLKADFHDE